jgi:hypothetical protein
MACDDRQLSEAQRQAGYQNQRTGVQQAVRPFSGRPTLDNLIDYINRELQPAVRAVRNKVNDVYLPVVDNAPSGNPLGFYFSTDTANADPTAGRIRLDQATQDTATTIRVSETNRLLADVLPWLDVMAGGATTPLGVVTLTDAVDPRRFIRFDLNTMTDAGAYWNLGVTPIESSHDNPFIDGGPVTIGFIPGVGGTTAATVPVSSLSPLAGLSVLGRSASTTGAVAAITATGRRQFLASGTAATSVAWQTLSAIFPGAPIYDVMASPFNATGDGVADDTAALNAAIAAANAAAGVIYLGRHHRITAALTPITASNVAIQGRGHFNGGTAISIDAPSADNFITLDDCQYVKIRDVWIRGVGALYTTGAAIYMYGCFRIHLDRLLITQMAVGIDIESSGPCEIHDVTISDVYGAAGIRMRGSAAGVAHAMEIMRANVSTSMPSGVVGFTEAWQPSTAYSVGNAVTVNGNIYQVVTAGTSAGSGGPSGVPGTTVANANTATITDGSVEWVWAMAQYSSFLIEEYTSTVRIIDSGALQGGYGIRMIDGSGGVNPPAFLRCVNVEFDHVSTAGISLEGGGQAEFEQTFVTSMLNGPAIQILDTFDGLWRFNGGVLFGSGVELMTIAAPYGIVSNFIMSGGGIFTLDTYDAIRVDANTTDFLIVDCSISASPGDAVPNTRYGISIAAGCDNYLIQGNNLVVHRTGDILNTPGTGPTRLVRNNIPDVFMFEVEETGAGPFNDYDPLGARHIMASNAAGVFTGVVAGGVGDLLIFSHQGTGYTELQHNTGSSNANRFIIGRLGKNLRIYDNETAVFRYIDATAGATAGTRWVLISPQLPFAHASDSALGDVVAHDGSHYVVVSGGGSTTNVLLGNATFGPVPATAITEVEETGAGPFNDYAPTGNARHVMASNAAGVFTGVSATGYVLGDLLLFSHQGTGFTEFQHNTGSTTTNRFFTGRQGKNLRLYDNEVAVFRYLDTTAGGTTAFRWVLISPSFPYAQADDDATGDIVAFNGTNYQRIVGGNSADVVLRGNATFGTVSNAAIRDSAALSVIGRSANSTGDVADITGTASSDAVLRVSGTTLGFGTVATAGIANSAVTLAKMENRAQATFIGRQAAAGTGVPQELTAAQAATILGLSFTVILRINYSRLPDASISITPPTGATWFEIECLGGGGGGGGADADSIKQSSAGGGGGAGGWFRHRLSITTGNITGAIGGGGSGGSNAGGNGGDGDDTFYNYDTSSHTGTGGRGGTGTAAGPNADAQFNFTTGGVGGVPTSSALERSTGGYGHPGMMFSVSANANAACGGNGGASVMGGGGRGGHTNVDSGTETGAAGQALGSGGGGGARTATGAASTGATGGSGLEGFMKVTFYSGPVPTDATIT